MDLIELFLVVLGGYLLLGLIWSAVFVLRAINTIDPIARTSSPAFKLLMIPGSVVLWPILLSKWIRA